MRVTVESVRRRLLLIPIAAAALAVGCGEGHVLQSPTGPSGAPGSAFLTDADGATTSSSAGEVSTRAKGGVKGPNTGENGGGPGRSHEDRVVGFVSAKAGDVLTVNGISVVAGMNALIRHGNRILTIAEIEVGDHLQARGVMEDTTLVAVEIKVQDTGHDNDDVAEAELRGTVAGLVGTATCPVVTFTIGTTTVNTSAATVFDDVTCAALANGALVEVEGTTQADGSVLATKVEAEAGPDEVEGFVFEFSGAASCPAATFKVGPTLSLATAVTTTGTTVFTGVTCATLANGAHVEVEGTKQVDGSITAASVELK